jgi:flagellin-specific chaperone FliS
MHKFSQEQLIQYVYEECSPILKLAIEKAIAEDADLKNEVKALQNTIKQLNKIKPESPSYKTIEAILKYARDSQKKKDD